MGIFPFRAVISFSRPGLGALPCQWWWRKEVALPEARRRHTFLGRREHGVTVDLVWQVIGQKRYTDAGRDASVQLHEAVTGGG